MNDFIPTKMICACCLNWIGTKHHYKLNTRPVYSEVTYQVNAETMHKSFFSRLSVQIFTIALNGLCIHKSGLAVWRLYKQIDKS